MTTSARKDILATFLTALAVLVYLTTHEGWNVWLIGDSHRWAAGAILLLGAVTCGLGRGGDTMATKPWDIETRIAATLGVLAGVFGVIALVTGSLTPLSLLVVAIVALWLVSTVEHLRHHTTPRHPTTA